MCAVILLPPNEKFALSLFRAREGFGPARWSYDRLTELPKVADLSAKLQRAAHWLGSFALVVWSQSRSDGLPK